MPSKSIYNWEEIQKAYDSGLSQSQLMLKFGFTSRSILLARKRGDFVSRSISDGTKLWISQNPKTPEWYVEHGKQVSATIKKKVARGEWHTSLARHMHIDYNGIDLHGSWEVAYAKYLDANKIKWIRNTDSFLYIFDSKERRYTPDFYLIDTDEYIEIKGYKTEKDNAKWTQFPKNKKLIILMHKELKKLGIIPR